MTVCDQGQSEVKQSRQKFEAGQVVKVAIRDSLEMVNLGSPGDQWVCIFAGWSRPQFQYGQGVKQENLMGQHLDCLQLRMKVQATMQGPTLKILQYLETYSWL